MKESGGSGGICAMAQFSTGEDKAKGTGNHIIQR